MSSGGRWAVVAAFGAVWILWGSTYLAIAWAVETIPPLLMIGARCAVAGAVLYGWGRRRGGPRPSVADWRSAALAGTLLFVTGQAVLAWAETRVPSGAASLLIASEPFFIALLAWRFGRGAAEASSGTTTFSAILVGFLGVALLVLPGAGGLRLDPVGSTAAVVAALSWSVGVLVAEPRPGVPASQTAGMQLLTASGTLLLLAVLGGEVGRLPVGGPSPRSLAAFGFLVVFGSIVTFGAYVWLLGRVGATRLSTHAYVNPLVAVALGVLLNDEALTPGLAGAAALILGSVALLLRRPAERSEHQRMRVLDRQRPGSAQGQARLAQHVALEVQPLVPDQP